MVLGLLAAAFALLVPPAAVIALVVWARRASRRAEAPRLGILVAYVLAGLGGIFVLQYVVALVVGLTAVRREGVDPSQKARVLGESIAAVMNCVALVALVALVAGAAILLVAVWRQWKAKRKGS